MKLLYPCCLTRPWVNPTTVQFIFQAQNAIHGWISSNRHWVFLDFSGTEPQTESPTFYPAPIPTIEKILTINCLYTPVYTEHDARWIKIRLLLRYTYHFWVTICKTVRPMLSDRCLSCLPVLSVTLVYYGQTVGWIKMKLGMQVGLGPATLC